MKQFFLFLLGLLALTCAACSDDREDDPLSLPTIQFSEASARYTVKSGEQLSLTPVYGNVDSRTTYVWIRNNAVVSTEPYYNFRETETGDYYLTIKVTNAAGTTEDELKITVVSACVPVVSYYTHEDGIRLAQGASKRLAPTVENDVQCTYCWSVNGTPVSQEKEYTFQQAETGTYHVVFTARNADGTGTLELDIEVCRAQDLPFSWCFPWTSLNIACDQDIKVRPYFIANDLQGTYSWTLDGEPVGTVQTAAEDISYVFQSAVEGTHVLTLTMTNSLQTVSQDFLLNVCPPMGTYYREATAASSPQISCVYEYTPAPGHQVSGFQYLQSFADCLTPEQAAQKAFGFVTNHTSVSLGAQGGYIVCGFDHSVVNSQGDYDLIIGGNPYEYQSEPGIIWVSQDVNGDGLPNDPWYELAGSEYDNPENCTFEYAIRYFKPRAAQSPTYWEDHLGNSDIVPYSAYWNPSDTYWQPWIAGEEKVYFGTRLADHHTYMAGTTLEPPYAWGYADNAGDDYFIVKAEYKGHYRLSNARTWNHRPANLAYIDFVKIQTAQTGYSPNLFDISTEVNYISDYHLE